MPVRAPAQRNRRAPPRRTLATEPGSARWIPTATGRESEQTSRRRWCWRRCLRREYGVPRPSTERRKRWRPSEPGILKWSRTRRWRAADRRRRFRGQLCRVRARLRPAFLLEEIRAKWREVAAFREQRSGEQRPPRSAERSSRMDVPARRRDIRDREYVP